MNFKELYKAANDNIHGDRKLIDDIFEKATPKKIIKINYMYLSTCAALVVVIFALSILPKVQNPQGDIKKSTVVKVTENEKTKKTSDDVKSNDENVYDATLENLPIADYNITKDSTLKYGENSEDFLVRPRAGGGNNSKAFLEDAEKGGIKAASVIEEADFSSDTIENITLTLAQYEEYLGFDLSKLSSSLTPGMQIDYPKEIDMIFDSQSGEYVTDDIILVAYDKENSDKQVIFQMSKIGGKIKEEYNKNNDSKKIAHFKTDNVWMKISSIGISEEEFMTIVDSFTN